MNTFTRVSIGTVAAGAFLAAGVVPATADVERRGMCSATSTWETEAEREGRFIEVDFEVDTATPGENWRLVVVQNGKRIFADTRPATRDFDDRMADVDWSIVARNKAGVRDRFVMTATNRASGERCRTTVRV